jgi:protein SCO1/2
MFAHGRWPAVVLLALVVAAACGPAEPEPRVFELRGQVLELRPERDEVMIRHEDIANFMPAMTMPFQVEDPDMLGGLQPGDLVTATLVVGTLRAYLSTLDVTGYADLDEAPELPAITFADLLSLGDTVPDAPLVADDGSTFSLADLRGQRVALTFIYTRCPLPDFCPLMDRHFAALQQARADDPALADVRLVSVSIDPGFDTPDVLRAHAESLGADPDVWHFVTTDDIGDFAGRFGVTASQDPGDALQIVHNLRTAVIDPQGRLVTVRNGNTWTPADLLADLRAVPAAVN